MTNFTTTITAAPNLNTTLGIHTDVFLGQNQIRRNVGHNVTTYLGSFVNDQFMEVGVGATLTQTFAPLAAMILQVSATVTVQVTVNSVVTQLAVSKLLVLDSAVTQLSITNQGAVDVQAHLSYATA